MVLVWFRNAEDMTLLNAGFGIFRATAYRYRDEGNHGPRRPKPATCTPPCAGPPPAAGPTSSSTAGCSTTGPFLRGALVPVGPVGVVP